jgi:hypothetical protein
VKELFEIVGIKPEVHGCNASITFSSTNRNNVVDFEARTGVKIVFSEAV